MADGALTLAMYDRTKYNVLMPTTAIQQVSPWHALRASEVIVDPDPEHGDVYEVGSKRIDGKDEPMYALAKPALMRIAQAAGIVWNWKDSGPIERRPDYVMYRAVGAIRGPDGTPITFIEHYDVDLLVVEDELREDARRKATTGIFGEDTKRYKGTWQRVGEKNRYILDPAEVERYVADKVRAGMIQWRKNKLKRAETGALLRVIRAALGLRGAYTKEELFKPFVVPRVDFSPDYSDPNVRAALIQHGYQAMASLFGAANPATAPAALPGNAEPPQHKPLMLERAEEPVVVDATEPENEPAASLESPSNDDDDAFPWDDEPASPVPEEPLCSECGDPIRDTAAVIRGQQRVVTRDEIIAQSTAMFGRQLCYDCTVEANRQRRKGGGAA